MESTFTVPDSQTPDAILKESFSDPFNVKSFSATLKSNSPPNLDSDFESMINDSANKSALNAKKVSIEQTTCETEDTTYFSTLSDQTNEDSQSTSEISLFNLTDSNNKTFDLQKTIVVRSVAQLGTGLTVERQLGRRDDTLERSVDPFNSNTEIDPFNTNISTFDSLSKDDPFNSRDDFLETSKIEDYRPEGHSEIDFGDDSKFDDEFEQLPSNVTYLEPETTKKQLDDESSFEKLDEKECAMARRLGAKLENIPEDSRERNASESEGEFENEFIGSAELVEPQKKQHTPIGGAPEETVKCTDKRATAVPENQAADEESKPLDKMVMWQIQNETNMKLKDEEEMKRNDQLKALASNELEDWYANYEHERKLRINNNRFVSRPGSEKV